MLCFPHCPSGSAPLLKLGKAESWCSSRPTGIHGFIERKNWLSQDSRPTAIVQVRKRRRSRKLGCDDSRPCDCAPVPDVQRHLHEFQWPSSKRLLISNSHVSHVLFLLRVDTTKVLAYCILKIALMKTLRFGSCRILVVRTNVCRLMQNMSPQSLVQIDEVAFETSSNHL